MEEMCVVVWVLSVWWLWFCISSSERKCKLSLNTAIKMEGRREGGALGLRTLICFSKHRTSTLSDAPLSRCRLPSSGDSFWILSSANWIPSVARLLSLLLFFYFKLR